MTIRLDQQTESKSKSSFKYDYQDEDNNHNDQDVHSNNCTFPDSKNIQSPLFLGFPILNNIHNPANIAIYAAFLGTITGLGIGILILSETMKGFGMFVFSIGIFHLMEYISTAMYHSDTVKLSAFLINHSQAYHAAMTLAISEFWIEYFFWPSIKQTSTINWIGFIIVIFMQMIRSIAMITAGSNFTHLVAYNKLKTHVLVKHGIYKYLRHPAYTSFFYWGICLNICLFNPVSFIAFAVVLWKFFSDRIGTEEELMSGVYFFGKEYAVYKETSYVLIPGIN